ncbi:putative AC transposase [Bienertia sinuspersici]
MFCTFDGRVSLTCDTWTSLFGEPFVCVIVHLLMMKGIYKNILFVLKPWKKHAMTLILKLEDSSLNLLLNGSLMNIRYYAYVLNLCVQEGSEYDVTSYVNKFKSILHRLYELFTSIIQQKFVGASKDNKHHHSQQHQLKNHSSKFPILARIAKDILAIPALTIVRVCL